MSHGLSEAISAFKAGRFPEAESACRQLLVGEPNNPDAWNLMGIIAGVAGQHRQAVEHMGRAVKLSPQVVEFRKNLARALIHLEQLKEAESVLQPIMASAPTADVCFLWGMIIGQQGDLAGAIQSVQKAIEKVPNEPVYHFNLAELFRRNGDFELARQSLRKTLDIAPNHVDALNNLSGLQMADGCFFGGDGVNTEATRGEPKISSSLLQSCKLVGCCG